jgi:hypothetical protein
MGRVVPDDILDQEKRDVLKKNLQKINDRKWQCKGEELLLEI